MYCMSSGHIISSFSSKMFQYRRGVRFLFCRFSKTNEKRRCLVPSFLKWVSKILVVAFVGVTLKFKLFKKLNMLSWIGEQRKFYMLHLISLATVTPWLLDQFLDHWIYCRFLILEILLNRNVFCSEPLAGKQLTYEDKWNWNENEWIDGRKRVHPNFYHHDLFHLFQLILWFFRKTNSMSSAIVVTLFSNSLNWMDCRSTG